LTSPSSTPQRYDPPPPPKVCSIRHDYRDVLNKLDQHVFGQHIATSYIRDAVKSHFEDNNPRHALSIVAMGNTGTGKNYISKHVAKAAFPSNPEYVHLYLGRHDFPLVSEVERYKERLKNEVIEYVSSCPRAIFIFDEIDKMPSGVIDVLKPFMDFHDSFHGVNFRKATFIFLTNKGDEEINGIFGKLRGEGILRQDMRYKHFEKTLREKLFNEDEGMFSRASVISDSLISLYVPFLPMEKEHVILCIRWELKSRGLPHDDKQLIAKVLEKMDFHNDEFSHSGCKRVFDFVNVEKARAKTRNN